LTVLRLDHEALVERAHGHDPIVHRHLVNLDLAGEIAGAADQAVRRRALVLDRKIAAGDLGAAGRGAAPGLRNDEIAGLDLLSVRGCAQVSKQGGHASKRAHNVLHGLTFVFNRVPHWSASGGYLPSVLHPGKNSPSVTRFKQW
jgi:hypothetical protein